MYIFVIDTNEYSGNFERQMTAYITGWIGECSVGEEEVYKFEKEVGNKQRFDWIILVPDEHGCSRPCVIMPTPGYVNNGMGKLMKADSKEAKKLQHPYPAYQSIGIFFEKKPTKEEITLMKERAKNYSKKIKILGFRLLKRQTIETEESLDE